MFLEQKTQGIINKTFDECKWNDRIYIKCDYCNNEFTKKKGKYIESKKKCIVSERDCCSNYNCRQLKREEANLIKYGYKSHFENKFVQTKIKQTIQEKYGVDNVFKLPEIRKKANETNLAKYGEESYSKTEEFKSKTHKTWSNKSTDQKEIIEQKRKKTTRDLYNVDNVFQVEEIKKQIVDRNIKLYGMPSFIQSDVFKQKSKKTSLEKYGTEFPIQSDIVKKKIQDACIEKHGTKTPLENEAFRLLCQQAFFNKYDVITPFAIPEIRDKIVYCKTQNEIKDWLKELGLIFESNWKILKNREIDLYNEQIKLGIEYCGNYWHNEQSPNRKDKNYHHDKYTRCVNQGIRLLTIFEDEWINRQHQCKNLLKSVLGLNTKIPARKCNIRTITSAEMNKFLDDNHILGGTNKSKICFGLLSENKLLGVMSLGRHPRQFQNNIVLDRLCFINNVNIQGGASKLFKHCVNWTIKNNYKKIISWSDNRWSYGNVYAKLGFTLDADLPPDYSYVCLKNPIIRISKQKCKKKNINCPSNKTEKQFMQEIGYARIWDCGKKRWIYKVN